MGLGKRANQVNILFHWPAFINGYILDVLFCGEDILVFLSIIYLYLQVYCIDFGLAKKYRDTSTHQHIPYR
jgi:casein kinase 1